MSAGAGLAPAPLTLPDDRPAIDAWTLARDVLHLNHGSYGAVTRAAQAAQVRLREEMEADPVAWFIALPDRMARTRVELAPFLGVAASDLALVSNASAGASAVFGSLPHTPGGEIVVTDHGYGAVTMGAERLARRWGGRVRTVSIPLAADAQECVDLIAGALDPRTRLLVIDQITSPTARRFPIERIAVLARAHGIEVLVDGAHAPGTLAEPVPRADVSWIGNLHKFACAPRGTAALVPSRSIRADVFPVIDSWGASLPFPERFDHQGTADATGPLAAPAALTEIDELWGWERVRRSAAEIAAYGAERIAAAFGEVTGDDHLADVGMPVPTMRLIRLPRSLADDPASAHRVRDRVKAQYGAATAPTSFQGQGYLRIATHAYSTAAHYDEFAERVVPALVRWSRERV